MIVYQELNVIFERFNKMFEEYLGDKLDAEDIIFTLQRKNKMIGCLIHNAFEHTNGSFKHEISLNPEYFTVKPKIEILRVFCQELLKLYRIYFGDPETLKIDFYDADWGAFMLVVGLVPSSTGKPDGKDTGKKMSSYILPDGPFLALCNELADEGLLIDWFDKIPAKYNMDHLMTDLYELDQVMELKDIHPLLVEVPALKRKNIDVISFVECLDRNDFTNEVELDVDLAAEKLVIKIDPVTEDDNNHVQPPVSSVVEREEGDPALELMDLKFDEYMEAERPAKIKNDYFEETQILPQTFNISSKEQIADLVGFEKPKESNFKKSTFKYSCGCDTVVKADIENLRFTCNSCTMQFRCETETFEVGVASNA